MEIAEAFAAKQKLVQSNSLHLESGHKLLAQFDLLYLAQRNPYTLSEGETKLIWFLMQWAKQPLYLVIGYLPLSLSKKRTKDVVDFLKQALEYGNNKFTVILGYLPAQAGWLRELLTSQRWTNILALVAEF